MKVPYTLYLYRLKQVWIKLLVGVSKFYLKPYFSYFYYCIVIIFTFAFDLFWLLQFAKLTFACSHYRYSKGLKNKISPRCSPVASCPSEKARAAVCILIFCLCLKKSKGLRLQIRMQLLPVVLRVIRIKSLVSAPQNQALVWYD